MRPSSIIILLLIPAFIALGHDFYLFYIQHLNPGVFSTNLLMEKFKFSALGFIWTNYESESFKAVVKSTDTQTWTTIDTILTWKAFYVGLAFAGFFIFLFLILKLFGKGPFVSEGTISKRQSRGSGSIRAGSKSEKINYSRK